MWRWSRSAMYSHYLVVGKLVSDWLWTGQRLQSHLGSSLVKLEKQLRIRMNILLTDEVWHVTFVEAIISSLTKLVMTALYTYCHVACRSFCCAGKAVIGSAVFLWDGRTFTSHCIALSGSWSFNFLLSQTQSYTVQCTVKFSKRNLTNGE